MSPTVATAVDPTAWLPSEARFLRYLERKQQIGSSILTIFQKLESRMKKTPVEAVAAAYAQAVGPVLAGKLRVAEYHAQKRLLIVAAPHSIYIAEAQRKNAAALNALEQYGIKQIRFTTGGTR